MLIASFLCHFNIVIRGINRLCPPISRHIPCKRIPCFCKCSFQYLSFFCPCISLSCFRLLRRSPFRRYRFLHTKGKFAPWAVRTTISERSPVGKRMSTGLLLYGAPEKTKGKINHHNSFGRQKNTFYRKPSYTGLHPAGKTHLSEFSSDRKGLFGALRLHG